MQYSASFPGGTVQYYFNSSFRSVFELIDAEECIVITDEHVAELYGDLFTDFKAVIIVAAGEQSKSTETVSSVTEQLIQHECHKNTFILGVGGGVVTDLAGFIGTIYMRGVKFGFVPTTLLGMVDASIGGKNGINFQTHKNLLGTIRQPQFILYDNNFLKTLPDTEWNNGFAEVVKTACLFDKPMFDELTTCDLISYQNNGAALASLVARCTDWKNKIVIADEQESNSRKLLNFGHTTGHAIEAAYQIPHGHAVSLGMVVACMLSEKQNNLPETVRERLISVLENYHLPTEMRLDIDKVMNLLKMDKKRSGKDIDYVLLKEVGISEIRKLPINIIQDVLTEFNEGSN